MHKIISYPYNMPLIEAFQANEIKFAFVNQKEEDFHMVHSYVKCRDYFNELLMTNVHPNFKYKEVYGFKYKQKEFPLDLSATRIALKFPHKEQKQTFIENLPWIHKIEEANNTDLTVVHDISPSEIVVIGSKMWVQKCLLTNIYTLLLKLMGLDIQNNTEKTFSTIVTKTGSTPSEIAYVQNLTVPRFNSILENCSYIAQIPTNYIDGADTVRHQHSVHESSGLMAINYSLSQEASNQMHTFIENLRKIFTSKGKTQFIKECS